MDQLLWILALVLAFIVAPLVLWSHRRRRRRTGVPRAANPQATEQEAIVPAPPASERSTSNATRRLRRRGGRGVAGASSSSSSAIVPAAEPDERGEDEGEDSDGEVREVATYYTPKQSKKKNERKQEKEARREAEAYARDARKEKQDRQSEMRRRKDGEREAEEQKKEDEAERLKLKEEAAAAADFDKWKTAFSVETEGTEEQDSQEEGRGLNDFVDYIKTHKCVALETLAGEFNLRTQDCIDRVVTLEAMGRISGVMDERGKFVYISPEEMKAVANYIKRLGRVSIAHLASKSNEFIDLEPKTVATDCAQEVIAEDGATSADAFLPGTQVAC